MKNTDVSELKKIANELRQSVIKMVYQAQSGHPVALSQRQKS